MLQNSFIHIPGIGESTERKLWERGILTWDDFRFNSGNCGLVNKKRDHFQRHLSLSIDAIKNADHGYFNKCFPNREKWRLYDAFKNQAVYLDIETSGLSPFFDEITVIGISNGKEEKAFVQGKNLELFPREISKYKMIITFNGTRFDIPFIQEAMGIRFEQIHIDLMYPLKRLGFSGGLKIIERSIGISRPDDIRNVDGLEAVYLWYDYKNRGNEKSLEKLVKYNLEDVRNLRNLMEVTYKKLKDQTFSMNRYLKKKETIQSRNRPDKIHGNEDEFCMKKAEVINKLKKLRKR